MINEYDPYYAPAPYPYAYPSYGWGWGPTPAQMKQFALESEAREIYRDYGVKPLNYRDFTARNAEPFSLLNSSTALGTLGGAGIGLLLQALGGNHALDFSHSVNWVVPVFSAAMGGIFGAAVSNDRQWSKNLSSYEHYLDDIIDRHHAEERLSGIDPKRFEKREGHAAGLER